MTKKEMVAKLKAMFIDKFGEREVELTNKVFLAEHTDCGSEYLSKIRYNGKQFEWYKDFWDYGWETTQKEINEHAIEIFSDALGLEIEIGYFIKSC